MLEPMGMWKSTIVWRSFKANWGKHFQHVTVLIYILPLVRYLIL